MPHSKMAVAHHSPGKWAETSLATEVYGNVRSEAVVKRKTQSGDGRLRYVVFVMLSMLAMLLYLRTISIREDLGVGPSLPSVKDPAQPEPFEVEEEEKPARGPVPLVPSSDELGLTTDEEEEAPIPPPLPSVPPVDQVGSPTAEEPPELEVQGRLQPLEVYEQWGLPTVEEVEERMPAEAKRGKEWLASTLATVMAAHEHASFETPEKLAMIDEVTRLITGKDIEDPIGKILVLRNLRPFVESAGDVPETRKVMIMEILGLGSHNLMFKVEDGKTHERLALRIGGRLISPPGLPMDEIGSALQKDGIKLICGTDSAELTARKKGVAVPKYTAQLWAGQEPVRSRGPLFVLQQAELMERFYGNLGNLWRRRRLPDDVKEYIARRLLIQVLHLQASRVSHSDLKVQNCFMRKDGSFLIGDMDGLVPFGDLMGPVFHVTLEYVEPELLRDIWEDTGALIVSNPQTDMWSLGAILYDLFMDAKLPYGLDRDTIAAEDVLQLAQSNVTPDDLIPGMAANNVPSRWTQLIHRLLHIDRRRRITAQEIIAEFPDLCGITEQH